MTFHWTSAVLVNVTRSNLMLLTLVGVSELIININHTLCFKKKDENYSFILKNETWPIDAAGRAPVKEKKRPKSINLMNS